MTLAAGIKSLQGLRSRLSPAGRMAHFTSVRAEYERQARAAAETVLLQNRPPGRREAEWRSAVEAFAALVGAGVTSSDGVGILLFLAAKTQLDLPDFLTGNLTLAQVQSYVQAGLDGDPLGKPDITDQDRLHGARAVAFRILRAIAQGTVSPGREEAIRKFVAGSIEEELRALLPAIREVWREVFTVRLQDDLRAMVLG